MTPFVGTFRHRVNSKGQVAFPAKLRENVPADGEGRRTVYLMKTAEPCLLLLRRQELEALSERLKSSGLFSRDRRFREVFFASIEPVDIDPQGRILLPPRLREEAGLGREVVFVGAGNVVEIWDEAAWAGRLPEVEALRPEASSRITAALEEI